METKKALILKVLDKLKTYWPLAESLAVLVNTRYVDEKMCDQFLELMSKSAKDIKNEKAKARLAQAVEYIRNIKEQETQSRKEEEADIDKMLDEIG